MKKVDFFFDFSSPFAYIASTQIEALARRNESALSLRPFLLGGLFKAIGTPDVPLFTMSLAKQRNIRDDMFRWADHYGIPLRFPSRFPINSIKPLRLLLVTPEEKKTALMNAVYRAYWADDRDISDDAELERIATAIAVDGAALVAKTKEEPVKAALKASTDEAVRLGVFGAPSFLVGDLLFWGQDRLLFVEKALQGWRPKGQ